jgi:hypothetical protein
LNSVASKLHTDYYGFYADFRWLTLIFILAMFCDALSTINFLTQGTFRELHPLWQFISSEKMFGPLIGPLVTAFYRVVVGFLIAVYYRKFASIILMAASILGFWAAWYNTWGFKIYTPAIQSWPFFN